MSSDPSDLPLSLISNLKYPRKTIQIRIINVNWKVHVLHGTYTNRYLKRKVSHQDVSDWPFFSGSCNFWPILKQGLNLDNKWTVLELDNFNWKQYEQNLAGFAKNALVRKTEFSSAVYNEKAFQHCSVYVPKSKIWWLHPRNLDGKASDFNKKIATLYVLVFKTWT